MKRIRLELVRCLIDKRNRNIFDPNQIKKVLFLRDDDKFGDMVISTISFRELRKEGFRVSVVAGANNKKVITFDDNVDQVFIYKKGFWNIVKLAVQLRKEKFDLVIDVGDEMSPVYFLFLRIINSKNMLGFNRRHYLLYNINIDYSTLDKHISYRHFVLLDKLGIKNISLDYNLNFSEQDEDTVDHYLTKFDKKKIVVLNPYTALKQKDLSIEQIKHIIFTVSSYEDVVIIVIGQQEKIAALSFLGVELFPFKEFLQAVVLIKKADYIVSPDTSIVHVAAAFQKPLVTMYRKDRSDNFASKEWGPNNSRSIQLLTSNEHEFVSSIRVDEIDKAIKHMIDSVGIS
ncbi:glycosyltransferase family 9 protein [Neisseria sp. Ec49-e6-T10]|uniref:glycosyltransferase family 9 protein n=1 Tax=Neisseria sp. Ec49-e6-T10 TaxID=3140744 RepID=UPI003EBBAC2A